MNINYSTIKEIAKERGRGTSVKDLVALAPVNDPFYFGSPAEISAAEWFADLWQRFGYTNGVHIRRMHYQIVMQDPPLRRPDGQVYENTEKDWAYLGKASKAARYLDLVNPSAFIDRRNPSAVTNAVWASKDDYDYDDPEPGYEVESNSDTDYYNLPSLPTLGSLPYSLDFLPELEVQGYEGIEQNYHIEIWAEKSTMNDVLEPLCERYNVNLITGLGEMSVTSVVQFLERVRASGRPGRILYISDYDPAGLGMPVSVSRKIEFFLSEAQEDLDIKLQPIVLTSDQVREYDLPRIPVKETDRRKANWEAVHGEGQVELDALEALHPGQLRSIIETAILDYYDKTLVRRTNAARRRLEWRLQEEEESVIEKNLETITELENDYSDLQTDFEKLQGEFDELVAGFNVRIEAYQERFDGLLERGKEVNSVLSSQLRDISVDLHDDEYRLPEPDLPVENDDQLYQSDRSYFSQLDAYADHKNNE